MKESLESLPRDERLRLQNIEARERRLELQATKKAMYKLRNKIKTQARKTEWQERLERITNLEEKLKTIKEIAEELERKHQEKENNPRKEQEGKRSVRKERKG